MKHLFHYLFTGILLMVLVNAKAQTTFDIRVNQVGYLPTAQKLAVVVNANTTKFEVKTADLKQSVFKGNLSEKSLYKYSEEQVQIADFTKVTTPGEYVVVIEGLGNSVPFTIDEKVFVSIAKGSIKAFYYNRSGIELTPEFAGVYARDLGHPDTAVIILPQAASAGRPAGTVISTPGGWYDAGDYNKYVVNSGITTFSLLSAYENYTPFYDSLTWNIPESGNKIPDILDEALWNIKWELTMQDPEDGGVYNKTTDAGFGGFELPSKFNNPRYVVGKGTAAALDFAAVMAMTARIYKKYDENLANEALVKAEKAWKWAKANPNVPFINPKEQDGFPAVHTGGYGDGNFHDEFSWATAELYITTKNDAYYAEIGLDTIKYDVPSWPNVKTLGLISLLANRNSLTPIANIQLAKEKLLALVEEPKNNVQTNPYRIPGDHFLWGGNAFYANVGMLLVQAYAITGNSEYFNAAVSSLDYLLGRNATTYCFVSGFGTKYPVEFHHRLSGGDNVPGSIPGFLAGGPNPNDLYSQWECGKENYPSLLPARAYLDKQCSYSTNEIAINWNAPLVNLIGAIQYEYLKKGKK